MYPNRYPVTVSVERRIIPTINPLKLSVHHIEQFHSEAAPHGEEDGWLPVPALLNVATCVRELRYHRSRVLL